MNYFARTIQRALVLSIIVALPVLANNEQLTIEQEFQGLRYASLTFVQQEFAQPESGAEFGEKTATPGKKSPGLAFLMSAAVPGLGQYYTGSLWKAVAFLGADVAAWTMHVSWHSKGEDMTDEFEAFNRAHWSRDSYEQKYLLWTYGESDDDLIDTASEISHHLPDEMTQQYYEMTGKYDQFSWGWDDANLGGQTLDNFSDLNPPPAVVGGSTVPASVRRDQYETMRDDANKKFDQARAMLMVALANRVISGFEAFFSAKKHNNNLGHSGESFGAIGVSASLKSISTRRDTPWLTLTYKF